MKRALIYLAVLALLLVPALASATLITTTFAGGNNNGGAAFDLTNTSANPITLTGVFDGSFGVGSTLPFGPVSGTVDVYYYSTGSYVGNLGSLAGWTLLGTAAVSGAGDNTPTQFNVGNSLVVAPGATIGILVYLDSTAQGGVIYTAATGATTVSDGILQLSLGTGVGDTGSTPLNGAGLFGNRVWNGSIEYSAFPYPPASCCWAPACWAWWRCGAGRARQLVKS